MSTRSERERESKGDKDKGSFVIQWYGYTIRTLLWRNKYENDNDFTDDDISVDGYWYTMRILLMVTQ